MNTQERKAMEQALEALIDASRLMEDEGYSIAFQEETITALRQCLEQQPADEPVAWMYVNSDGECEQIEYGEPLDDPSVTPLYTRPQEFVCSTGLCHYKAKSDERLMKMPDEPVAWGVDWGKAGEAPCVSIIKRLPDGGIEVMAVEYGPQPAAWVGLTDEEIDDAVKSCNTTNTYKYFRAIEAKLKEKNT